MRHFLLLLALLLLSGCGGAPVETGKLKPPSAWMMAAPCRSPKIPKDEANPGIRAGHYADSRACSARKSRQVIGLQRYIRAVRRSS